MISKTSAEQVWEKLSQIYCEVLEDEQLWAQLAEEMSYGGLGNDPDRLLSKLDQADPVRAVRRFQELNPKLNTANLDQEEKYEIALGLISMYDNS